MFDTLIRRRKSFYLLLFVMLFLSWMAYVFAKDQELIEAAFFIFFEAYLSILWYYYSFFKVGTKVVYCYDRFTGQLDIEQMQELLKQNRLEKTNEGIYMLSICAFLQGDDKQSFSNMETLLCKKLPKNLHIRLCSTNALFHALDGNVKEAKSLLFEAQQLIGHKKIKNTPWEKEACELMIAYMQKELTDEQYKEQLLQQIIVKAPTLYARMVYRYLLGEVALKMNDPLTAYEQLAWLQRFALRTCLYTKLSHRMKEERVWP